MDLFGKLKEMTILLIDDDEWIRDPLTLFFEGEGYCVCPSCGERATHELGTPCFSHRCPNCGATMTRE